MDQATLDSINLLKVEAILNKFGYPNVHQVSYEYNDVIWLVLQHQKIVKSEINIIHSRRSQ